MGNISQSARNPYGFILVRNRLKRLKELVYRSGGSLESSLREDCRLSVRFCPNSPFAPLYALTEQLTWSANKELSASHSGAGMPVGEALTPETIVPWEGGDRLARG